LLQRRNVMAGIMNRRAGAVHAFHGHHSQEKTY
jgi:hypothetical protein